MDFIDEISKRGAILAIVTVISATAGAVIAVDRYTIMGFVRAYISALFAMILVWSYGIEHGWSNANLVFYGGSFCVFADFLLVGILRAVKVFVADPIGTIMRLRK